MEKQETDGRREKRRKGEKEEWKNRKLMEDRTARTKEKNLELQRFLDSFCSSDSSTDRRGS